MIFSILVLKKFLTSTGIKSPKMKKTVENHSEGEEFDADEPDEVDEENNAESDKVLIALLLNVTSSTPNASLKFPS